MSDILCLNAEHGTNWSLYQGDCVELARQLPSDTVDFSVFSPPFSNLYTYSDSDRDMGNCVDDEEFIGQYAHLVRELFRVVRPGRIVAVHCKDLVNYKNSDGKAGLRDFPGELIRAHTRCQVLECDASEHDRALGRCGHGFAYASKVTIWKSPVTEMQRTKAHGLLYKQLRRDSTFSRQGLPDYVIAFRKWADEEGTNVVPVTHTEESFPLDQWQEWASPVWMSIDQTNVLNVEAAREDKDEKHMAPLQLDVIQRCLGLWSNPGDVVLSPFAGIGSEGHGSLVAGRRFVGFELKESYFRRAALNLHEAETVRQPSLFDAVGGMR